MGRRVIWTAEAVASYERIIEHLKQNWTDREVLKFIEAVEATERTIVRFPRGSRRSEDGRYHEMTIIPHNIMIYSVRGDRIIVHVIWDTRRDPRTRKRKGPRG
jgi:plasmid stabilization system protein ParE